MRHVIYTADITQRVVGGAARAATTRKGFSFVN